MTESLGAISAQPAFTTRRKDRWWVGPALVAFGLLCFIVYATWRAFANNFYDVGNLISPFYSPLIKNPFVSPAIVILWAPAGFRMTCYYYRKAYYRSLFATPPACAVRGVRKSYKGETAMLLFQNLHRFMLYIAIFFVGVLFYDAYVSFDFNGSFGVSVGTIVLTLNACLLGGYTFGCHCWRHLIGGNMNCFTGLDGKPKTRYSLWRFTSKLNAHHMTWAWMSLIWVGFTDFYVRQVACGAWPNIKLI